MSPPNELPNARERFRLIGWSLLASVILNLFLVGVFVGVVPHTSHHGFSPMALAGPHGDYLIEWMARTLDAPDAAALREAYKSHATMLRQAHDHVHQAIDTIDTTFKRDQADPAALQAALQKLATARNEVHEATATILETAYIKVSPAGRQKLSSIDLHSLPSQ